MGFAKGDQGGRNKLRPPLAAALERKKKQNLPLPLPRKKKKKERLPGTLPY